MPNFDFLLSTEAFGAFARAAVEEDRGQYSTISKNLK